MDRRTSIRILSVFSLGACVSSCAHPDGPSLVGPAPGMPSPEYLQTNRIQMAVYRRGVGLPIVFCHGFPELAFSWRHQFHAAAEAGFSAIAPDLRGYGLTDKPSDVSQYTTARICDDLIGMMDEFGIEKAIFCGHDWGGFVVDTMPVLYPERCAGIIGIGAANNLRPPGLPLPEQTRQELVDKEHWNLFMQEPGLAEKLLDNNAQGFFGIMTNPDYFTSRRLTSLPEDSAERSMDLARMLSQIEFRGASFLPDRAFQYYVDTFNSTGFTGGLNWYRAMGSGWDEINARAKAWEVAVPYLYIWPEQDPINRTGIENGMEDYVMDIEKKVLSGSGHFAMEEKSDELAAIITEWLLRKFADYA